MNENNQFDLLYIFRVILRKKKFILGFSAIALIVALVVSLIAPKQYTSSSIFIVKNPILLDRNYIFRNQMFENKEFFAVPDDVDQIEFISKSEAMLRYLINEFDLGNHYGIKSPYWLRLKVKGNFAFSRQDTKNIEIFYTDKDPEMAMKITKAVREYLELKFSRYFLESNRQVASALKLELKVLDSTVTVLADQINELKVASNLSNYLLPSRTELGGSTPSGSLNPSQLKALEELHRLTTLKDQLTGDQAKYNSLIHEFELIEKGGMNVLYLVQDAYLPDEASHPKVLLILIGTLLGSLIITSVIAVFGAFYRERIKA